MDYTGSASQNVSGLRFDERAARLVLLVDAWEYPTGCRDIAVPYPLTAGVSQDLGDRSVGDGACQILELQRYCNRHVR